MAVLHKKEEKIQAVLGRLPQKYTEEEFVEAFIKYYSKDWGKIKSAYIKQSQDKEPGYVINMPKPEIYLKQILANYLQQRDEPKAAEKKVEVVTEIKKEKAPAKKKVVVAKDAVEAKKTAATAKKKAEVGDKAPSVEKKPRAAVKKPATKK